MKEERRARFMAVQETISSERLKTKIGTTLTVLVDEVTDEGAVARSTADAPEIDGVVHVNRHPRARQSKKPFDLQVGEFAHVKVTASDAHDLFARPSRR